MRRNFSRNFAALVLMAAVVSVPAGIAISNEAETSKMADSQFGVRIGSVLNIEVFKEKELSGEYRVGETGKIIFPLIGEIQAADLSTEMFRQSLVEAMRKYIKEPMISVSLVKDKLEIGYDVVLVLGQVKTQGAQPMTPAGSSLLKAIAQAGGFTPIANPRSVKVVSRQSGERKTTYYNLFNIFEAKADDPEIFAGDVVYVGESTF